MAFEQIKQIKEAEDRAEQIRRKAATDVKQLELDAEQQASGLLEEARSKADAFYRTTMDQAASEAEAAYDDILKKAQEACVDVRKKALNNLDKAVTAIMERVVS